MSFVTQESRAILKLTLPIVATQIAQVGMGTIDTLMSGHVSTQDLAAVAIGTSLWTPAWLFLAGCMVALSSLASRMNSSGEYSKLPYLLGSALWVGLCLGVIAGVLLWISAEALTWLIHDPETARIAAGYTHAVALSMPAGGVFLAYRFYAEALNQPGQVTAIMLTGLLLNIPVNAIFIYGWFGMPALGGIGCGVGTFVVLNFMAIVIAFNTRKKRLPSQFPLWQHAYHPDWRHVRRIFKIGIPIGIAVFFEVTLFTAIALFLTELGPSIVAGHQIALNLSSLTFMLPLSLGMALTVRVGHYLGAENVELARRTAWIGVFLTLGFACVNAVLMATFASFLAGFYSPDPEVVAIAAALLLFAAVFQLSDGVQVACAGALRGYQDTLAVMLITFVAYWLVGLGSGYYLAFWFDTPMGAQGFWTGLVLGLTVASIALAWRLRHISHRYVPAPVLQPVVDEEG